MNIVKLIGVILIVLGVAAIIYGGISYTSKDDVDLGPMHIQVDRERHLPVSPIAGILAAILGGVLIYVGGRRHTVRNSL